MRATHPSDKADLPDPGACALCAATRGWPGAAIAIGPAGQVLAASGMSGMGEGDSAPFDLPSAAIASQLVDRSGRMWRLSAPVAGVRFATAELNEAPDAAHRFTAA
ncbi:MAG: hypothetical protein SGJ21_07835, partial [Alphaproteobacteria bacterium]|nr:hypothetical protein [Alphaproteobacteria bacterium]